VFSIVEALIQGRSLDYAIDRAAVERDVNPLGSCSILEALVNRQEKILKEPTNGNKEITESPQASLSS